MMFPQIRQQLSNKLHAMEIEDLTNRVQALEFTDEEHQQKMLRLNEKINYPIENRHIVHWGCLDNVLCFLKKEQRRSSPGLRYSMSV